MDKAKGFYDVGYSLMHVDKYEEALIHFDCSLSLSADYVPSLYWKGFALNELERFKEAVDCFDKALALVSLESSPSVESWRIQGSKGFALMHLHLYEEALAVLDAATTSRGQYRNAWHNKGIVLKKLGRYPEALQCFKTVRDIDGAYVEGWYRAGCVLLKTDCFAEAIQYFEKTLDIDPQYYLAFDRLGQVYLRQGKHSEAELYFKNALKIQPTYYRSLYNLGYLKNAVSQYSEAVVYLKDSLVHNAKNSQAWGSLGFAYLELLELDESLRCLDEALKIDPQYRNALNNKAKVLLSMGRLEEAYKCCEFSCGVDPNSEVTFDLKGTILENMGKLKESLVCFKEAIRIDPNYSRPWASLGFVYIQLHSWQEALNALNSALSLEPNYPLVLKNKSYTLIQLGRYAEAKESADKALEISPNFDEAWFCKGLALFALKEYQLASIAFDKVILLQSGHFIYALNYKGLALDYLKNEDSRIYYTEAIKVDARTTAEWYVSIRPVHGKVCTIPIARKTVSGPVTPSHPVHEQLSPPSTASSSPNEKSPVSPRKNISIKVGQGTIRSPIGKKPILHSQKSTVKEGNPKDGTVANRMNFEGTVGGAGRPLLIFPRTYIVPTTDIHEAALRGMGDKWKEYQIRFSEIITEHITKTQITKDAIIKYNLTFEEAAAIVYYTADASIFGGTYLDNLYIILNQQLAQRQVDDNFKPFLYYLIRGLHKLPSFVGVVYRGVSKPITSLSAQYRVGNQIVWVAFTSTSKSRHIMHKFSKSQTSGGTWMQLKVNQGKDIAEFSLCDEGEVLLMPNTYFILKEFLSVDMKELAGLPSDLDCLVMEQQDTPNSVKSMFES